MQEYARGLDKLFIERYAASGWREMESLIGKSETARTNTRVRYAQGRGSHDQRKAAR